MEKATGHQLTSDIQEQNRNHSVWQIVEIQQAATNALEEADSIDQAIQRILDSIGTRLKWTYGFLEARTNRCTCFESR